MPISYNWYRPSSAGFYPLTNFPFSVGLAGLYGCTSLIVMSTKGVWLSHFWENPSIWDPTIDAMQQQLRFQQTVLDILGPGDDRPDFPGLQQYLGKGNVLGPDAHVQAVIISPRNRDDPVDGVMMFTDSVHQIARTVTRLFGGNWDTHDNGDLATAIIFVDYSTAFDELLHEGTSTGKAIFQYDPVQGRCINKLTGEPAQFAQQRLWFEDRPTPVMDYFWPVWPEQAVPLENSQQSPNPQQTSKRRSHPPNETGDDVDHISLEKRQEIWTPGVQPSLYPSCLAVIENTGTGTAEATAILVGPNGPVSGDIGTSGLSTFATSTSASNDAMITSRPLCSPL